MQRAACAIAILLLLLAPAVSAEENPALASHSSVEILQKGEVSVQGGSFVHLWLNLSVPRQTDYQNVTMLASPSYDSEGNPIIAISEIRPPNPYLYSRRIVVSTARRTTPQLPATYIAPSNYSAYLQPSDRTQSDSASIRAVAKAATENASTPFEKVVALAQYVNQNTEYDSSMVGEEKDAEWVLANGRGVCMEFSTLFAALARAEGIPTRYLLGYVYSERFGGWIGHAWNEVYLGDWVPVDATWFEVGTLDATHIEEGKHAEIADRNTLLATVSSQQAKLKWDSEERGGALAGNIGTLAMDYAQISDAYNLSLVESGLPPGAETVAYLSLSSDSYAAIPVSLATCGGTPLVAVDEPDRFVILEAGKPTIVYWVVRASGSIPKNYYYTCPLTLNSPFLASRAVELKIDPTLHAPPDFFASLDKAALAPGEQANVLFSFPSPSPGRKLYVFSGSGMASSTAFSAIVSIPFTASGKGQETAYAASEGGGVKKLPYTVEKQGGVRIDSLSLARPAYAGQTAEVTARVAADSYPRDITLSFSVGPARQSSNARISAPASLSFEFIPSSPGAELANLSVAYEGGGSDSQALLIDVQAAPSLSLSGSSTSASGSSLSTTLRFAESGSPVNATIEAGGAAYSYQDSLTLALPEGEQEVVLRWHDASGNRYSKSEFIVVRRPTPIDSVPAPVRQAFCPAQLALIFLTLAAPLAIKRRS